MALKNVTNRTCDVVNDFLFDSCAAYIFVLLLLLLAMHVPF